jgi:hypothetical protein
VRIERGRAERVLLFMRSSTFIASLAAFLFSTEALAQPAQPPVAGQPATTDPQQQQPPVAGQGGSSGGGQTVIIVQGNESGTTPAPKELKGPPEDAARFRGGVSLNGGVFALPSIYEVGGKKGVNMGAIGPSGHLGVQINDLVGVYAVPGFDLMFGKGFGADVYLSVLVDFTFADRFTVGVGPDVGDFGIISLSPDLAAAIGGGGFGGRIHLAAYPYVGRSDTSARRRAFSIGLDTRILAEQNGAVSAGTAGAAASIGWGPALHVMLSLGYEAL